MARTSKKKEEVSLITPVYFPRSRIESLNTQITSCYIPFRLEPILFEHALSSLACTDDILVPREWLHCHLAHCLMNKTTAPVVNFLNVTWRHMLTSPR